MPVKSGNCVKTGAQVLVLEYGRVQTADLFLVGDCILINFGANIHEGRWPAVDDGSGPVPDGEAYQVIIGLDGFWHDTKNALELVPLHQFQGEIIRRNGRRERLEFKKPE